MLPADELIARFVQGAATPEERAALFQQLRVDPDLVAKLYLAAEFEHDLHAAFASKLIVRELAVEPPRHCVRRVTVRRKSWAVLSGLAALIGFAVVGWLFFSRSAETTIAVLTELRGAVQVTAAGQKLQAKAGDRLTNASSLDASDPNAQVTVTLNDGSKFKLAGGTVLGDLQESPGGVSGFVVSGAITVSAAKQLGGRTLIFSTPEARVEVVGTLFTLAVKDGSTQVNVTEGCVKLSRISDSAFALVSARQYSLCSANIKPVALVLDEAAPAFVYALDTTAGWGDCHYPEMDKALQFSRAEGTDNLHEGTGAVRLAYDGKSGVTGMKYFALNRALPETSRIAFWLKGDGSAAKLVIRLSQRNWGAWDCPPIILDFKGWRRIELQRSDFQYVSQVGERPKDWDDIFVFAMMFSEQSADVIIDDLRFYK